MRKMARHKSSYVTSSVLPMAEDREIVAVRTWPDVEEAIEQLIRSRRSENTREAYRSDWRKWLAYAIASGADLKSPGLAATTAFRDELVKQEYAPASVARILSSLSFFYSALRDAGLLRTNPFAKTWLPRPEVSDLHKTPAVEDAAVARLESALEEDDTWRGLRDVAIVRLLFDTGLRRSSLAVLRRDQLRRHGDDLIAFVTVKGGKEKSVKIPDGAREALDAWLAIAPASPYVFPMGRDPSRHLALATFNKILTARSRLAGLDEAVTPHRFRAAFITTAYDARVYERDIQAAAHHSNAATTRGYDRGQRGDGVFDRVAEFRDQKKHTTAAKKKKGPA